MVAGKSAADAEIQQYSEPSGDEIVHLIILPRKTSKARFKQSVPKSTQMGEENILRRSGEPQLRNSAKLSCNFGRKDPCFGRAQ